MRGQIVAQTLQAGAQLPGGVRVAQGERVPGNDHYQHQQNGHHVAGYALNAAFHAVVHDKGSYAHEQQGKHHRRHRRGDKTGKVAVLSRCRRLSGKVDHGVFGDPPADNGVVGHNKHRHQKGEDAEEFPFGTHLGVSTNGALLGAAADGDIRGEQGKTEGQHQCKVHQQKQTAAVLCRKVGEPPQVAHAHRTAGSGKHKADLPGETACFLFHDFQTPILTAIRHFDSLATTAGLRVAKMLLGVDILFILRRTIVI